MFLVTFHKTQPDRATLGHPDGAYTHLAGSMLSDLEIREIIAGRHARAGTGVSPTSTFEWIHRLSADHTDETLLIGPKHI